MTTKINLRLIEQISDQDLVSFDLENQLNMPF